MESDPSLEETIGRVAAERRDGVDTIPVDTAVRTFLNPRRRIIVRYLLSRPDETVTVDEVVEAVETAEELLGERAEPRQRIVLDVKAIQLPYLDSAGIVEYDADAGQVDYVSHARVELLLQCIEGL